MLPKGSELLPTAKALRKNMTPQERKLWHLFLKAYPAKIYRQRIIGNYIADFYCDSAKLIIEIDGSQHYEERGMAYDEKRSAFFAELGLSVIRYSNADINVRFWLVCEDIDQAIQSRLSK